jgi:hypothetical protein
VLPSSIAKRKSELVPIDITGNGNPALLLHISAVSRNFAKELLRSLSF